MKWEVTSLWHHRWLSGVISYQCSSNYFDDLDVSDLIWSPCRERTYLWSLFVQGLSSPKRMYHQAPPLLFPHHPLAVSATHIPVHSELLPDVNQLFILSMQPECRMADRRCYISAALRCPQGWGLFPWPRDSKTSLGLAVLVWQLEF